MCRHLLSDHLKDYLAECERLHIPITTQDATHTIVTSQGINPNIETPRPQFTSGHFIDALVEFIVATDQVCLNFNFY